MRYGTRSISRLLSWMLVLSLLPGLASCVIYLGSPATHREKRVVAVPHAPAAGIEVRTRNGSIEVHESDLDEVRITATLKAISAERLAAARIVADRADDGRLRVRVAWPGDRPRGNEGCSFAIEIPEARGVGLHTSNGSIGVVGLSGEADIDTSNGSITVRDQRGPVRARTSNGAIRLEEIGGEIQARSSNGRIEIHQAAGPVVARTSNGRIKVGLHDACAGPVQLDTSNGSVSLEVGRGFEGELRMRTSSGRISIDRPAGTRLHSLSRRSATISIGDSNTVSTVETSNGNIDVIVRGNSKN